MATRFLGSPQRAASRVAADIREVPMRGSAITVTRTAITGTHNSVPSKFRPAPDRRIPRGGSLLDSSPSVTSSPVGASDWQAANWQLW